MVIKVRDVDKLDPLPDEKIKQEDKAYLDKHKLDALFSGIMYRLLSSKPKFPIQFIIDCIEHTPELAEQDVNNGLSVRRRNKLADLFRHIDKGSTGRISFRMLQQYTNKFGGHSLSSHELQDIFADFNPQGDTHITESEFFMFFSKISAKLTNKDFDNMVNELMT